MIHESDTYYLNLFIYLIKIIETKNIEIVKSASSMVLY